MTVLCAYGLSNVMGNCFGIFGDSSQLLDNEDTDDSIAEETTTHQSHVPVYHPHPGLSIPASRLTEEEQLQIVKRIDMIQFLPSTNYVPANKDKLKECIICMCDLKLHDEVRYLPCLHTYHRVCIDDWLMRSFVCPSCLRPVEVDFIATTANTANENSLPITPSSPHDTVTDSATVPGSPPSLINPKTSPREHQPAAQGDAPPISPRTLISQARISSSDPESATAW